MIRDLLLKAYAHRILIDLVVNHQDNTPIRCAHFSACGGCDFQDKPYAEQLAYKQTFCRNLFARFPVEEFQPIIPSPRITYYRNKAEFCAGPDKGRLILGMRRKNSSRDIIDVKECTVFSEGVDELLAIIRNWAMDQALAPYILYKHTGIFRYVSIRQVKSSGELLVVVVVALTPEEYAIQQEKFAILATQLKQLPRIKSLYLCLNKKVCDDALTEELILLSGEKFLSEAVNGITYLVSPTIFLQANPLAAEKLYDCIKHEAASSAGDILDMYCGSGGISLQLAGTSKRVVGVDNSPHNIRDAQENARANKIKNVEFICADADDFLARTALGAFGTVILDPPRIGLSKKGRATLLASAVKRIIYVSCNPMNLREDLKSLTRHYAVKKLIPVDMFPQTKHIEVIALLHHRVGCGGEE